MLTWVIETCYYCLNFSTLSTPSHTQNSLKILYIIYTRILHSILYI
nr:MAG TPA: hypothetical protein [Caudoviricetes sp.]